MNVKLNKLSIFLPTYVATKATAAIFKYSGTVFIQFESSFPLLIKKFLLINLNFLFLVFWNFIYCMYFNKTIKLSISQLKNAYWEFILFFYISKLLKLQIKCKMFYLCSYVLNLLTISSTIPEGCDVMDWLIYSLLNLYSLMCLEHWHCIKVKRCDEEILTQVNIIPRIKNCDFSIWIYTHEGIN